MTRAAARRRAAWWVVEGTAARAGERGMAVAGVAAPATAAAGAAVTAGGLAAWSVGEEARAAREASPGALVVAPGARGGCDRRHTRGTCNAHSCPRGCWSTTGSTRRMANRWRSRCCTASAAAVRADGWVVRAATELRAAARAVARAARGKRRMRGTCNGCSCPRGCWSTTGSTRRTENRWRLRCCTVSAAARAGRADQWGEDR